MAIRQVGGAPVYVIDVQTPKPTDSRGRGYGMLVSDLRWKLWEEVQNSQLQQMKFDQLNRQVQLDVLEQQQRDISRAIRNANELKAEVKSGKISSGGAAKQLSGTVTVKTEPARDPFTGEIIPGETIETKTVRTPFAVGAGPAAAATTDALAQQQAQFEKQQADLDAYISELESQQTALGQKFAGLAGQPIGADILTRTREAFQTQIGEGGFGISRRPLRQLPRFDELESVGLLQDTLQREESALLDEAQKRIGAPLTLQQEQDVRKLARDRIRQQMEAAGAEPTSRAGFLMKPPPAYEPLLPTEQTLVPTGRFRDEFGVEGASPLTREQEVIRDIGPGRTNYEKGFRQELGDVQATQAASKVTGETPLEYATRRRVEMEALGANAGELMAEPSEAEILAIENQKRLDEARLARDRGFNLPVEDISGFKQTVMGRPGGMADEAVVRRLIKNREEAVKQADEAIKQADEALRVSREPEPPKAPSRFNLPTIDASGMPISPAPGGKVEELGSEQEPQAKLTVPQRRDLYAMRTVKQGLELAEKPKQFARVAKTETPDKAPEYVKLVNGIYDINAAKPNRFKLTYDEISRALKNDPATRQKAHAYLVAKDALETNVQNPLA